MKMLFARFVNSYCERRLSLTISGCTAVKILRLEMQRSTLTDWLGWAERDGSEQGKTTNTPARRGRRTVPDLKSERRPSGPPFCVTQ